MERKFAKGDEVTVDVPRVAGRRFRVQETSVDGRFVTLVPGIQPGSKWFIADVKDVRRTGEVLVL